MKKSKLETVRKYVSARLTGHILNHTLNVIFEIEHAENFSEEKLDIMFKNYLDNLESSIDTKNYWLSRFFQKI